MRSIIYGAVANILLNCMLIPFYGMLGAAVATVATECLVSVIMLKYAAGQALPFVSLWRLWRPVCAPILEKKRNESVPSLHT